MKHLLFDIFRIAVSARRAKQNIWFSIKSTLTLHHHFFFLLKNMDSTKNFFEAWMNTQSQIAGKLKETFENQEVVNKSVEFYKMWFDNQKSLAETMFASLQPPNKTAQVPDMMQGFMDFFGKGVPQASASASTFMQNPQDWYENIQRGMQTMMGGGQFGASNFMQMPEQVSNMVKNAQTYLQMMSMWQKMQEVGKGMGVGAGSLEEMMKMFDMTQYKTVLDGMFQFMTPDKSQNFLQQIQQYNQAIFQQFPQLQSMMGNMPKPEQMLHNSLQTVSEVYQNFSEQFHKFMNPYFTTAPAGREKEISSLMMQVQDKLVKYYMASTEAQQLAYETGKKAMEKTIQTVMQKVGTDFKAMPFEEFYSLWVDTMENDTITFFGSTEYSTIQGKVVQLGLEIKTGLEKQMEKMLAPLPVVPRSEMDALNKTIHDLKRKVRDLEQSTQASQTQEKETLPTESTAEEKPAPKTTARKTTKK